MPCIIFLTQLPFALHDVIILLVCVNLLSFAVPFSVKKTAVTPAQGEAPSPGESRGCFLCAYTCILQSGLGKYRMCVRVCVRVCGGY